MVMCFAYIHVLLNITFSFALAKTLKSHRQHNKSFFSPSTISKAPDTTEPTNGQIVHNLDRKPCKLATFYSKKNFNFLFSKKNTEKKIVGRPRAYP